MGPSIDYFVAAPAVDCTENKARWRQHSHRSVETSQRRYSGDPPRPEKRTIYVNGLWPSCADTLLRLSARAKAITVEPRRVSAQLGAQRSHEIVNRRFPV